jgi:hypothetical protein
MLSGVAASSAAGLAEKYLHLLVDRRTNKVNVHGNLNNSIST